MPPTPPYPTKASRVPNVETRRIDKIVETTQRNLAENLTSLREKMNLTQLELAELAGVDRKTINRIENGHFSPSVDTLTRLSIALNTSIANLL
jgi:putative transcriptional regulator